jgi:single-strand DNA-binding protein
MREAVALGVLVMLNKVLLIGNLVRDVELKYTQSGSAVAKFSLAVNRTWKDRNSGEKREEVCYVDINIFGRSAEVANQHLSKGSKVLVEGRLVLDQWQDQNGQKRSKHSVAAESFQFLDSKNDQANNQSQQGDYQQNSYDQSSNGQANTQQNNDNGNFQIDDSDIPF